MKTDYSSIGVDLGGTKIAVALVDARGQITTSQKYVTDVAGGVHQARGGRRPSGGVPGVSVTKHHNVAARQTLRERKVACSAEYQSCSVW